MILKFFIRYREEQEELQRLLDEAKSTAFELK